MERIICINGSEITKASTYPYIPNAFQIRNHKDTIVFDNTDAPIIREAMKHNTNLQIKELTPHIYKTEFDANGNMMTYAVTHRLDRKKEHTFKFYGHPDITETENPDGTVTVETFVCDRKIIITLPTWTDDAHELDAITKRQYVEECIEELNHHTIIEKRTGCTGKFRRGFDINDSYPHIHFEPDTTHRTYADPIPYTRIHEKVTALFNIS